MTQRINQTINKTELTNIVSGLQKAPPGGQTSLMVAGVQTSIAALITEFQHYIALIQAVDDAEAQLKQALAARDAAETQMIELKSAFRVALKGALGPHNPLLEGYGITPNKTPAPLTGAQEVAKAAKAKATRAARHTMGSKQKAAVTGATATAAPVAAPAPAATPAKAGA